MWVQKQNSNAVTVQNNHFQILLFLNIIFIPVVQFGNPYNPSAQKEHLSPLKFSLHVQIPFGSQVMLVDPLALQLQSETYNFLNLFN